MSDFLTNQKMATLALANLSTKAFAWLDRCEKEFELRWLPEVEQRKARKLGIPHVQEDMQ